jgi:hypothetical protein
VRTENVSKAEKSRFWIAYFLDDIAVDDQFGHGLLHMTLIPWFVSDRADAEIISSFQDYFSGLAKFDITFGAKVILGSKKRAPVTSIRPDDELLMLHSSALRWFDLVEGRWAVKTPHVGDDFHPHIRHRRGKGKQLPASRLTLDSLVLVKAQRQEDWLREAAAKVKLK